MGKLTPDQLEFLQLLASRPHTADPTYRPAVKLAKYGYATREKIRGQAIPFLHVFTITDAGRAALDDQGGEP